MHLLSAAARGRRKLNFSVLTDSRKVCFEAMTSLFRDFREILCFLKVGRRRKLLCLCSVPDFLAST